MFVLGIRCDNDDVNRIPAVAAADYYVDHGVLVFPRFTRAVSISNHGRKPTVDFWRAAAKIIANRFHAVDTELPWISEDEEIMVKAIQERNSQAEVSWYYLPADQEVTQTTPESNPVSEVD
jgi:hypothetical protein